MFVYINAEKEENNRIIEYFGLEDGDLPTMRVITLDGEMKKYKPATTDITEANVKTFMDGFFDGSLKVSVNSLFSLAMEMELANQMSAA